MPRKRYTLSTVLSRAAYTSPIKFTTFIHVLEYSNPVECQTGQEALKGRRCARHQIMISASSPCRLLASV